MHNICKSAFDLSVKEMSYSSTQKVSNHPLTRQNSSIERQDSHLERQDTRVSVPHAACVKQKIYCVVHFSVNMMLRHFSYQTLNICFKYLLFYTVLYLCRLQHLTSHVLLSCNQIIHLVNSPKIFPDKSVQFFCNSFLKLLDIQFLTFLQFEVEVMSFVSKAVSPLCKYLQSTCLFNK